MAQAISLQLLPTGQRAAPFRASALTDAGGLGVALGASAAGKKRFLITGAGRVTVRAKGAVTGTVNLAIIPMLANASTDDSVGTRSGFDDTGTALPALTALANNTENARTLVVSTSTVVEVEITTAGASSWDPTTAGSFVDVEAG